MEDTLSEYARLNRSAVVGNWPSSATSGISVPARAARSTAARSLAT